MLIGLVVGSNVFLDATTHLYKRSCSSGVRLSDRPSVPCYFRTTILAAFKDNKYRGGTSDATTSSSLTVSRTDGRTDGHDLLYRCVVASKKSSNDIIINGTRIDNEVVASDVPPRCLFKSRSGYKSRLIII